MSVPAYRAAITTAATIILTVAAAIHIDFGITTLSLALLCNFVTLFFLRYATRSH